MMQAKRILLVDDDYDHLLVCSIVLQKRGYQVRTLAGCKQMEELVETVEDFHPDLIFMDQEMPGICGMDLIRMLKSTAAYEKIPVVYFTGHEDIEDLAKKAGANGYFRKPFQVDGLITTVQTYLA